MTQVKAAAGAAATKVLTRLKQWLANNPVVPKWCKTIIALLLLPVCVGAGAALWRVVRASGEADTVWVAALSGVGCWLAIYLLLPKPMWIYVFGHELTHALWTWIFGGKVKRFKVTADGGHVLVSKSNFLIALAPYFCPLYALLVVGIFGLGQWLWGWQGYAVWFHLFLGAAYAFHVTLTWHILRSHQSDVAGQGYVFSAVVIWLGNAAVLLAGIPWLTARVSVSTVFGWWAASTVAIVEWLGHWTRSLAG